MKVYYTYIGATFDVIRNNYHTGSLQAFSDNEIVPVRFIGVNGAKNKIDGVIPVTKQHFLFLHNGDDFSAKDTLLKVLHESDLQFNFFLSPVYLGGRNNWVTKDTQKVLDMLSKFLLDTDVDSIEQIPDAVDNLWEELLLSDTSK